MRKGSDNALIGTIMSPEDSYGRLAILIDGQSEDEYKWFSLDELVSNYCAICKFVDDGDFVACNKCNIGMHRTCVVMRAIQTAEQLNDENNTLFCKHCEENDSDDDSED
jgi:hypothetical protein